MNFLSAYHPCSVPGVSKSSAPLLEHLVEKVADGATCFKVLSGEKSNKKVSSTSYFFVVAPCPIEPNWSQAQAPARSLADHHQALAQELAERPELAMHLSTRGLGCQAKNAARQYHRAVKRHGFALILGSAHQIFLVEK